MISKYETYPLSRIVSVQDIVSADYILGLTPANNNHAHKDAWEICICAGGEALVQKDDRQILLQAGEIAIIQPGCIHDVSTGRKDSEAFVVSFTCSNSSSEYLHLIQEALLPATEYVMRLVDNVRQELMEAFQQTYEPMHLYQFTPNPNSVLGTEQMICCFLELLLLHLLREVTRNEGRAIPSCELQDALQLYLVESVTAYIKEHLREKLTGDQIAAHFHYSRSRLSTIYKEITGMGLRERIIYERIEKAKQMLSEQDKPILQIAEELGFNSPHYFSHRFAEAVGCSPRQYAARCRKR